jgi:hypothetical protein
LKFEGGLSRVNLMSPLSKGQFVTFHLNERTLSRQIASGSSQAIMSPASLIKSKTMISCSGSVALTE